MNKSRFLEFKLLISCFTFTRLSNLIKVESSRLFSFATTNPIIWGYPYAISIEPTSYCNLKCMECPSGSGTLTRNQGQISMDLFKQIIDETSKYTFYLTLYFQGEPLMHPEIGALIAYAKAKRMFVFTSTNGHFLSPENAQTLVESKLDKIIISLDGATQVDYERYRINGTLKKAVEGMSNLANYRKQLPSETPIIVAQVLLLKTTENQLPDIKDLALRNGVDFVEFKKAQFYNPNDNDSLLPQNPKYRRYEYKENFGWNLKAKKTKNCKRLWAAAVITWDGRLLPCCYDKDAHYPFGDLNNVDFKTAFKSLAATDFRKQVTFKRDEIEICCNCGE